MLKELESEGKYLAALEEHYIHVSPNGSVKLRGVEVLDDPAFKDAYLRANYISAATIISGLFGQDIPPDMAHLVNLMQHNFDARSMFPVHAALVPVASYAHLVMDLHEYVKYIIPMDHYHTVLLSLFNVKNVDRWDEPGQPCLTKKQKKALEELRYSVAQNLLQTELTNLQILCIEAIRFLDYMRHRIAHRCEAAM